MIRHIGNDANFIGSAKFGVGKAELLRTKAQLSLIKYNLSLIGKKRRAIWLIVAYALQYLLMPCALRNDELASKVPPYNVGL